ncbi:MAG: crotonase/enoyl-CoA hydratase family protein [Pseudomonadales bacterium]
MSDAVTIENINGVADVRINRPDKRNAIDGEVMDGLLSVAKQIKADKSIRAVVLSGEGKGFCAGLDMASFGDMISGDLTADSAASAYDDISPAGANRVQQLGWAWQEMDIPVIAAIHGGAMGGGLNLALGADIRVVAPNAKLGFVEITFGLLPDMSATQSLRHIVGLDRIKELILTGRKFTGEQAYEYGLATVLSDTPREEALSMARVIAGRNPDAVRSAKRLLNDSMFCDTREGLIAESDCSRKLMGTANQIEAIMSGFESREPVFTDPE